MQDGGWADVEIAIPDVYDDLRFGPIATAGDAFTHDIALWSAELANSGAPVSEVTYDLRYREVGTPDWTTVEDIDALTYTTTGLDPSTEYEAQVKAKNADGESDWSPSGTGTTSAVALPNAVAPSSINQCSSIRK